MVICSLVTRVGPERFASKHATVMRLALMAELDSVHHWQEMGPYRAYDNTTKRGLLYTSEY